MYRDKFNDYYKQKYTIEDMYGNVFEKINDMYEDTYHPKSVYPNRFYNMGLGYDNLSDEKKEKIYQKVKKQQKEMELEDRIREEAREQAQRAIDRAKREMEANIQEKVQEQVKAKFEEITYYQPPGPGYLEALANFEEAVSSIKKPQPKEVSDEKPEENSDNKSDDKAEQITECIICMDAPREVLFLNCRHMVCCKGCMNLQDNCPICRAKITERIVVIIS